MADSGQLKIYPPAEERLNIFSHATGLVLSAFALVLMLIRASRYGSALHVVSVSIFGLSLMALYAASTAYHSAKDPSTRLRLRILDHATIYVLIAGTYTPFTLVTLNGPVGWTVFAASWGMAAFGVILKLFFTGRFTLLSTLMYVFMGWIIVFVAKPMIAGFPINGIYWIIAGGVAYTLGAVLYSIRNMPFHHAAFHVLAVAGSICHFIAVYVYLLPHP